MEFLILVAVIWTPYIIILIKDILWNLHYWESKEYRFGRFFSHIYWDREERNRSPFVTYVKFICFCLASTLLVSPISAIAGIALTYIISIFELFSLFEKFLSYKLKPVDLFKWRNIAIIILLSLFLSLTITLTSLPFLILTRINQESINFSSIVEGIASGTSYPDIYLYLGIVTMIYIILDLSSPLLLTFLVFLTSPIGWIKNRIKIGQLKSKLSRHKREIHTVAVIGSHGKSTTKGFIYDALKNTYKVLQTNNTYSSMSNLANDIIYNLNKDTEIILVEAEAYHKNELTEIFKTIRPNFVVFTDLGLKHLEGFKSIKELKQEYSNALNKLPVDATLVYNAQNTHTNQVAKLFSGKKIPFKINNSNKLKNYIIPAIALVKEFGIDISHLKNNIKNVDFMEMELVNGDKGSIILMNNTEASYKTLLNNLKLTLSIQKKGGINRLFLITNGIHGLGKYKLSVYRKLIDKINNKVDYLITTDSILARIALKNNHKTQIIKTSNESEILYRVRENLSKNDIILIEGKLSYPIVESLRSQDS